MAKNFVINTVFRAVDKTSRVLGKMRTRVSRFVSKVSKSMKKLNRATSKISGGLTKGLKFGAVAAAGAVTGLAVAINSTADAMDNLAKTTSAMNFPIEEFQEYRFAAEQAGVTSDVFDKSLKKFSKTVGELKGGYGAMFTALKKTNPELLKQLKNTDDVDKAFDLYLSAIRDTPGAMDKAALASAGFGRAGTDMINMANLSATELASLRAEMRENGVVTAEQAAQAEKYNDMMNRVKLTITGLMVNVLTPLMPILTEIADKIRIWAVANKGIVSAKFKEYITWIIDNFPEIVYWVEKIGGMVAIFYAIATAIKVVNAALMMNPIVLIVGAIIAAIAAIIIFRKEIKEFLYKAYDWIVEKFEAAKAFFIEFWTFVKDTFWGGVDAVVGYFVERWEFAKTSFMLVFDGIVGFFSNVMTTIMDFFQPVIDAFIAGWEYVGEVFSDIWNGIKDTAASVIDWIMAKVDLVVGGFNAIGGFLGFGDDEGGGADSAGSGGGAVPRPIRPSVDISRRSEERFEHSEVTIKDETGRAKQTKGEKNRGFKLVHSGGMP